MVSVRLSHDMIQMHQNVITVGFKIVVFFVFQNAIQNSSGNAWWPNLTLPWFLFLIQKNKTFASELFHLDTLSMLLTNEKK